MERDERESTNECDWGGQVVVAEPVGRKESHLVAHHRVVLRVLRVISD